MKKIFSVLQVQNEADIIESLCRYYCSFCDGILITENWSSDNTLDILRSLIKEGLPVFITDDLGVNVHYDYQKQFHLAIDRYQADIILPNDADEFLVCVDGGNPRPVLESLDETVEYHIQRRNFICPQNLNSNMFFPENTGKYVDLSSPKTIMSRFLFKKKGAYSTTGRHEFMHDNNPPNIIDMKTLCYNHYPVRNVYQFMLKAIIGWAGYLSYPYHDGSVYYGECWHWKAFYDEIKKHGMVSQETLERCSAYTEISLPDKNNYKLLEEQFDTSFCQDRLKLRYTDYSAGKDRFLQMLTTQLEYHLRGIPSWRPGLERKVAGEQLGLANVTINNLNAYIETLNKQAPSSNRNGRFYFDTGKNFSEEETVHFRYNKEQNGFYYELVLPENTQFVRFDPVEGCGCFLQNLVIISDSGVQLDYQILNGLKSENNGIAFTTTDPQILIDVKDKEIKKLTIQCDIWFFI
jgi:hypothetical protein